MKKSSQNKPKQRQAYHNIGALLGAAALSAAVPAHAADDASTLAAAPAAAVVNADTAGAAANAATAADSTGIASVTVTATRRNASLQSVPLAVSVIDGAELARTNRNSIDSIVSELPSVNFRQQGGNKDTSIFVRGIGTISTSPGVEPTVSTVVDGVVYARPGQATIDLLDIDRLEVLRGPQGTLFGKNASAGVINIVSRKPTGQTTGFVDGAVYQGGERRAQAGISGTLVPGLAQASLTLLSASYDGNVTNLASGDKVNGYDRRGARARVDLTPTPDLDISLIADILHSGGSPTMTAYKSTTSAFAQAVAPVVASPDNRTTYGDIPSDIQDLNKGLSAQVDWRNGGYTFTSITAVRDWNNEQHTTTSVIGNSADASRISAAYPATRDIGTVKFEQVSQELRVASPKDQFAEYVAGAFYMHGKDRETYQRIVGTSATTVNSGLANYGVVNNSSSLFGETTLHFTPDLRGIVGARWTHDELEYDHSRTSTSSVAFSGVQPAYASSGETSANGKSGRLGAQYDFSPDVTGYATYSRGYKGPAYNVFFNMLARDTIALKPETSNSFELGLKSSAFDHRLTANLAVFKTDYDNYQANFYDTVAGAVVTRLINAGKVSTRGVEVDVNARPVSALTLAASLAYTDARIDQFNCPTAAAASCSLNGKTLPFSPSWKSFVRANYTLGLDSGLKLDFGSDYSWQSETQYDLFQSADAIQGAYGIVNASIALSSPAGGWRVALVGKNLGNKSYATNLVTGTGYVTRNVPRDDERYFGINVRKDF
jgi:iron complex outermembrane receptor protein